MRWALAMLLVACERPPFPAAGSRVRLVEMPVDPPSSCKDGIAPRALTAVEERVHNGVVDEAGERPRDVCRALCGDDAVGCYSARMRTTVGCPPDRACQLEQDQRNRAALFCGEDGARAAANPIAAQRALPLVVDDGGLVMVCELR